jgi:hypothetical protein
MALFVDLDDDGPEPPQHGGKPMWTGILPHRPATDVDTEGAGEHRDYRAGLETEEAKGMHNREARESTVREIPNPNRNSMTEALGCDP